jgi:hypothetical protein
MVIIWSIFEQKNMFLDILHIYITCMCGNVIIVLKLLHWYLLKLLIVQIKQKFQIQHRSTWNVATDKKPAWDAPGLFFYHWINIQI